MNGFGCIRLEFVSGPAIKFTLVQPLLLVLPAHLFIHLFEKRHVFQTTRWFFSSCLYLLHLLGLLELVLHIQPFQKS